MSVAQNPTDWKRTFCQAVCTRSSADLISPYVDVDNNGKPGSVLGCDFSGVVVKVGKNVDSPKIGDHVAGFVHGACFEDEGAYAEYIKTPADLVWVVPENTLNHDQAATLGCAYVILACNGVLQNALTIAPSFWTAVQALYHPTRLGLVEPPSKVSGEEWVLLFGGSCESVRSCNYGTGYS